MKRGFTLPELLLAIVAIVVLVLVVFGIYSLSANWRAKNLGGTVTKTLPAGKKLVSVTWKSDDIWVLVRDSKDGEKPETLEFIEYSGIGVLSGKVVIEEK